MSFYLALNKNFKQDYLNNARNENDEIMSKVEEITAVEENEDQANEEDERLKKLMKKIIKKIQKFKKGENF